jgi:hypothetical protein
MMTDAEKQELRTFLEQELLQIVHDAERRAISIRNDPTHIGQETLRLLEDTIRTRIVARTSPPKRKRGQFP